MFLAASFLSGCAMLHLKSDTSASSPSSNEDLTATNSDSRFETVVLFATGNIQGALLPASPDVGGAALLESYYKISEQSFGARVLWLDAGNLRGRPVEYDFDHGQSFEDFVRRSGMAATRDDLDQAHRSSVVLQAGRIKVGVVSADDADGLKQRAQEVLSQGAQIVVWLTSLPIQCNPHSGNHAIVHKPGESSGFCEGKLHGIIAELPEGLINAVIASGNARPVQRFVYARYSSDPVAGIPVVEASPFGKDVHLVYLTYDLSARKLVYSKTRIEGPVPVLPSHFHGNKMSPDPAIEELIAPSRSWLENQQKIRIAKISEELSANPRGESALGDLVADAVREETGSEFSIVHPGMVKHATEANALHVGDVSMVDLNRIMPADGQIRVITVSGDELKTLVRISENGSRGFSAVSGMHLRLIRPDHDAPATDLDDDHTLSLWEQNRLLEMTDQENEPIAAKKTYRLAVPAYLVDGGDDWQWASRHFALAHRDSSSNLTFPSARQLVAAYLKKVGKIDSVPTRIKFENPPNKGGKTVRRRRKHKRK
jgi:2',3'-cyclic-nucleotide 2'-phosphodiesterase (5'-nucleotidase family)